MVPVSGLKTWLLYISSSSDKDVVVPVVPWPSRPGLGGWWTDFANRAREGVVSPPLLSSDPFYYSVVPVIVIMSSFS
jgi:hypothetical protein